MTDEPINPNNDEAEGIVLDVSVYTVGDVLDLSDEGIDLVEKLRIIQKGVLRGDLRAVPLVELPEVVKQISMEINDSANPT